MPDMGENTLYAVGTLYRMGQRGSWSSTCDHIGIVDSVGVHMAQRLGVAFVNTLCGREGKMAPHTIRDVQETDDWFDSVGRERLSDFLCLTCKRVWDRPGE